MTYMFWKKKPTAPTQEETEAAFKRGADCIDAIISNSRNESVHFLQIHLTGMDTIGLLYGKSNNAAYVYNDIDEFLMRAGFRIAVVKSCLITLSTFANVDGKNPSPDIFDTAKNPDFACGWIVQGQDYVPLTATQTFGFFHEAEHDEIAVLAEQEKYEKENNIKYENAWSIV